MEHFKLTESTLGLLDGLFDSLLSSEFEASVLIMSLVPASSHAGILFGDANAQYVLFHIMWCRAFMYVS